MRSTAARPCADCGRDPQETYFRPRNRNRCYDCEKAKHRARHAANREREQRRQREYRERAAAQVAEQQRTWRRRNAQRHAAGRSARKARRRARRRVITTERIYRAKVWARDRGVCGICGEQADPSNWHLDHVIPIAQGGHHVYANVQVSHPSCNIAKGARV